MFDRDVWARVPFHFWSVVFFVLGSIVGSFLNVCIHRMPRGESIISPPSHCPHCHYSIPWWRNIPLLTWLSLRGRCANCAAPISSRYFIVELLTGALFLGCWLSFGRLSPTLAVAYCVLLAGFVAATFIDFEHFIIPDEITLGGIAAGFLLSGAVPELHNAAKTTLGMKQSLWGIAAGAGIIYAVLRLGKLLFGREKITLPPGSKIIFTETALLLPDREIPFEDIFYRRTDTLKLHAERLELVDRSYWDVTVRLRRDRLEIGAETLNPETILHMEAVTGEVVRPREAMGLGDVKFMAAIGAFLGAQAVVFSLMVSAIIGSAVGITLIALRRQDWSSRLPYGPYIALAATLWIFGGRFLKHWWLGR